MNHLKYLQSLYDKDRQRAIDNLKATQSYICPNNNDPPKIPKKWMQEPMTSKQNYRIDQMEKVLMISYKDYCKAASLIFGTKGSAAKFISEYMDSYKQKISKSL